MRLSLLCRAVVAPKTPYAVLGVSRTASAHELRQAYLVKVKQLHPDSWARLKNVSVDQSGDRHCCDSDEAAAEKQVLEESFKNLQNAWYILQDPVRRHDYDHHGVGQSCQEWTSEVQMRAEMREQWGARCRDEETQLISPGAMAIYFIFGLTLVTWKDMQAFYHDKRRLRNGGWACTRCLWVNEASVSSCWRCNQLS